MCIAIYKPAGKWVSKEELRTSFENNPHGAGFAYHNGEEVVVTKGFFTFRSFWKAYKAVVTNATPAFAHFRIATRGAKDAANCHPFLLPNGALMHNGPCLNYVACSGEGDRSDSKQFAEDFIAGLTPNQVQRIKPMIEVFIGTEKVVLMFDSGEVFICNEDQGMWEHGCWFSNDGHHKRVTYSGPWPQTAYSPSQIYKTYEAPALKPRYVYDGVLGLYLPREVTIESVRHLWDPTFSAYLPLNLSDDAMADDEFVYDWPGMNDDPHPVGEVIHDEQQLRLFLQLEPDTPITLPAQPLALAS